MKNKIYYEHQLISLIENMNGVESYVRLYRFQFVFREFKFFIKYFQHTIYECKRFWRICPCI